MDDNRLFKISKYFNRVKTPSDPVSIQAGITDFCFNQCHMCGHHLRRNKTEIKARRWIKFLSDRHQIESVCYSGGDPMAKKDFNDIMEYHISSGIAFGIITAGYFPSTINLNMLAESRWVRASLDSIDPETYAACRGLMGVEKVLESLKRAKENGVNIELTITVSRKSAPHLPGLFDYAIENNLNADIHPVYGKLFSDFKADGIIADYQKKFKENNLVLAPYAFNHSTTEKCYAPYYQIFIDAKGDIYPCCVLAGDTKENGFCSKLGNISDWYDFLRNREKFSNKKISEPGCGNCIARFIEINSAVENNKALIFKKNFF
jgi:radical SAM protein with 4Fe4S-binding SPASM domain